LSTAPEVERHIADQEAPPPPKPQEELDVQWTDSGMACRLTPYGTPDSKDEQDRWNDAFWDWVPEPPRTLRPSVVVFLAWALVGLVLFGGLRLADHLLRPGLHYLSRHNRLRIDPSTLTYEPALELPIEVPLRTIERVTDEGGRLKLQTVKGDMFLPMAGNSRTARKWLVSIIRLAAQDANSPPRALAESRDTAA
jgi:hypothetical protein